MFREKKICFYVLYYFLNQTIGNMVHTSYVAHNVYIWMKFVLLYKGVIVTTRTQPCRYYPLWAQDGPHGFKTRLLG